MPTNPFKLVNLLMLLLALCWATGLGRAIHEWTDHDHPATPVVAAASDHDLSMPSVQLLIVDDHDGCITCQQFAVGIVATLIAVVMVLLGDAWICRIVTPSHDAPDLLTFLPSLPSCGPPASIG